MCQGRRPCQSGEVEDADVQEVDDQTIEQLQQRLGRQTE